MKKSRTALHSENLPIADRRITQMKQKLTRRRFGQIAIASVTATVLGSLARKTSAQTGTVVNPVEFMTNTSSWKTLQDPDSGGIVSFIQEGDYIFFVKNNENGSQFERFYLDWITDILHQALSNGIGGAIQTKSACAD